jgi:hypothetical protein
MDAAAVRDRAAPVREDSVRSLGEGFKERVGEGRRAFIFLFVFFSSASQSVFHARRDFAVKVDRFEAGKGTGAAHGWLAVWSWASA